MIVYEVKQTEKTKEFDECIFVETTSGIYVEVPGSGFFIHPTIKKPGQLHDHLTQLKKEGFLIKKSTHTSKVVYG